MPDVQAFLERFQTFGARPGVDTYLPLFHPEATLSDAGMERPIRVPEIPEHIEGVLKLAPDFHMTPERWRERDGTVFVEASNTATVGRGATQWRSIYCVDLDDAGLVVRGRRYYDRQPLFARLNPSLPALPGFEPEHRELAAAEPVVGPEALVRAFGAAFERDDPDGLASVFREDGTFLGPDLPRPLARGELPHYQAALCFLLARRRMELVAWAGDAELVFAEWELHAQLGDQPVVVRVADRFDLAGGLILAGRAYFDTLALATRLAGQGGA